MDRKEQLRRGRAEMDRSRKDFMKSGDRVCLFDGCNEPTVGCHVLSRKRALGPITEEGHVLQIRSDKNGKISFLSKGVKRNASVFPGFCHEHDNTIFQDLDSLEGGPRLLAALSAIRSAYHQALYKKHNIDFFVQELGVGPEDGPYWTLVQNWKHERQYLCDISRGIQRDIGDGKIHDYPYLRVQFTKPPVFVASGMSYPESTLVGKKFNVYKEHALFFCFLPDLNQNGSQAVFMVRPKSRSAYHEYFGSFALVPGKDLAGRILGQIIDFSELAAFRPSWAGNLRDWQRREIFTRYRANLGGFGVPAPPYKEYKKWRSHMLDLGKASLETDLC